MTAQQNIEEAFALADHGRTQSGCCVDRLSVDGNKHKETGQCESPFVQSVNNDSGYFTPSPVLSSIEPKLPTTRLIVPVANNDVVGDPVISTPIKPVDERPSVAPSSLFSTTQLKSRVPLIGNSNNRFVSPHLIGHFIGRRRVDFMRELRTMNLEHVAVDVVRLLSPYELHIVCQVSRTWRDVCLAEHRDRKRLRSYLAQRQIEKENGGAMKPRIYERDHIPLLLGESQNWSINAAASTENPSVPKDMARFMRFTEEAKNLEIDQLLDKCPRCSSPARVNQLKEIAECRSTNGCGLVYCVRCRCERLDAHVCESPLLSPPRSTAVQKSRQDRKAIARKNLRRLLS